MWDGSLGEDVRWSGGNRAWKRCAKLNNYNNSHDWRRNNKQNSLVFIIIIHYQVLQTHIAHTDPSQKAFQFLSLAAFISTKNESHHTRHWFSFLFSSGNERRCFCLGENTLSFPRREYTTRTKIKDLRLPFTISSDVRRPHLVSISHFYLFAACVRCASKAIRRFYSFHFRNYFGRPIGIQMLVLITQCIAVRYDEWRSYRKIHANVCNARLLAYVCPLISRCWSTPTEKKNSTSTQRSQWAEGGGDAIFHEW